MEEIEEVKVEEQPTKPGGRAALMEMYRASNPENTEDPDDEGLMDFAHGRYYDLDGKYNELSGANSRLAELVSKDPRMGAVLSMIAGEDPKSLPYAMGNVYGKDWIDADPEEFEKGYKEHLARLAASDAEMEQAAKNVEDYAANLETFASANGLDESQIGQLHSAIEDDAKNMLMGIITPEFIDFKWKGLNYDRDVEEAAVTGEVEGRNQAIEVKKKKITGDGPLPDLATGTGDGKRRTAATPRKGGSFFDGMDETNS